MPIRFRVGPSLSMAADIAGDWSGHPVLLLHGGGQTRNAWGYTMAALAEAGFLAISLDLRGHGYSDWAPDGDYSVDAYAEDLRSVIAQINRPVALVGASLGGLTSLIAAGEEPRVPCTAIILVDVVPRIESDGRDRILEFMRSCPEGFASIEEAASSVAKYLPHRPRPADISGLANNLRLGLDGRYRWHWDPALLAVKDFNPERFEKAAQAISAPILLVRGRMSEVVSEAGVNAFRKAVPDAEYLEIKGAGHMVAGDRNDVFTADVVSFLSRKLLISDSL